MSSKERPKLRLEDRNMLIRSLNFREHLIVPQGYMYSGTASSNLNKLTNKLGEIYRCKEWGAVKDLSKVCTPVACPSWGVWDHCKCSPLHTGHLAWLQMKVICTCNIFFVIFNIQRLNVKISKLEALMTFKSIYCSWK